jgi:hypothetical protein
MVRTLALLLMTAVFLSAGAVTLPAGKALAYGGGGFGKGVTTASSLCTQQRVCSARLCVWRTICH